jgi:hypothetical protein
MTWQRVLNAKLNPIPALFHLLQPIAVVLIVLEALGAS